MGDELRQDEKGLGPDGGMKKAKGFEEDTEGHVRLRAAIDPEGLKAKGWGDDTEGHLRLREADEPEMQPDGLSNHPRAAGDDEDVDGHLRR